jgi:hypothetical protein
MALARDIAELFLYREEGPSPSGGKPFLWSISTKIADPDD